MNAKNFKKTAIAAGLLTALGITSAEASHFRGGAIVPTVDANGLLTVTWTSFWRKSAADTLSISSSAGGLSTLSNILDSSDVRFDKRTITATRQLTSAQVGTLSFSTSSCCRVSGIPNVGSASWTMNSSIVWSGAAASPILFNFNNINPEVVRGVAYSDNLGAVSGNVLTLSYDQVLNGINSQPPGFLVNTATGELTIDAANTLLYLDNGSNLGADYAFSGNIRASDGSFVEFDWLFDGVGTASNLSPDVTDVVINALVGDIVNTNIAATDPNVGDSVTLSLVSAVGPTAPLNAVFTPGAAGNPTSGNLVWNTAGFTPGQYVFSIQGSDGNTNDVGTISVNLSLPTNGGPTGVPEPATLALFGLGLVGAGLTRRRRKI